MNIWSQCLADIVYYDNAYACTEDIGYQVRLEGDELVLTYEDREGPVEYRGKEQGAGHFWLYCPERKGVATLHRFPDGNILEGYWIERGCRGMWRITLE